MDDSYFLLDTFLFQTPLKKDEVCHCPQERCLLVIIVTIYQVLFHCVPGTGLSLTVIGASAVILVYLMRKQRGSKTLSSFLKATELINGKARVFESRSVYSQALVFSFLNILPSSVAIRW